MSKLLNFIGTLLTFCFLMLVIYFMFVWLKYDVIKKDSIELFTSKVLFLVLATALYVITAFISIWAGGLMMTDFKLRGIIIIAIQVLFLVALIFMYKQLL